MEMIRDYDGRSERRARQIQDIVGHLGQMSARPVIPELPEEVGTLPFNVGWDSLGDYHDPQLRLELWKKD